MSWYVERVWFNTPMVQIPQLNGVWWICPYSLDQLVMMRTTQFWGFQGCILFWVTVVRILTGSAGDEKNPVLGFQGRILFWVRVSLLLSGSADDVENNQPLGFRVVCCFKLRFLCYSRHQLKHQLILNKVLSVMIYWNSNCRCTLLLWQKSSWFYILCFSLACFWSVSIVSIAACVTL